MGKTLIIAEKPSVANDLQRALSKLPDISNFSNKKDFFENDKYIISSAIGHLIETKLPTTSEGKSLPWKFEVLPVIPDEFELQPSKGTKSRFTLLKKLMNHKDTDDIINACDAGREGELIFRLIVKFAKINKPVKRLWLQSMTQNSIIQAFKKLRTDEEMIPLSDAAFCRSESDWLIGINSTRAMTAFNSKYGGFQKTPVGRVQTPTLAILTEREIKIKNFVSEKYFEINGEFQVKSGKYNGTWYNKNWKKNKKNEHDRAERIWKKNQAEEIKNRCEGKPAIVEEETKPQKQSPALLYDLTSLQRDAANKFGFSARATLRNAQALYEKHKAITYPRTDSRHLPEDYLNDLKESLKKISKSNTLTNSSKFAQKALDNNWVIKTPKYFNDKKISDHFAIVPTGNTPAQIESSELKLLDLIVKRTISAFFPPAEWQITNRITKIKDDWFKTSGKILEKPGWLEIYQSKERQNNQDNDEISSRNSKKDQILIPVEKNETATNTNIDILEKDTKPPARYSEATLLSAMETAGKFVQDEELKSAMKERGLGTPATRANIIEGLINDKYITRNEKQFFVNNRGIRLIEQLQNMKISILASPEMTGEWEYKLKQIESNKYSRKKFMGEIKDLTNEVVKTAKTYAEDALNRTYPEFNANCPQCNATSLGQDEGMYKCKTPECTFKIPKVIASRPFEDSEIRELINKKFLSSRDGFLSRFRQPFAASLELVEEKGKLKINFIFEKTEDQLKELDAIKDENNIMCPCPICSKGNIYITDSSYICDNRALNGNSSCHARLSRNMCKYEIPVEQARKFFLDGGTDLIDKFISKKGRPFTAKLKLNTKGKRLMIWEFQKKAAAKQKPKTPAKAKA